MIEKKKKKVQWDAGITGKIYILLHWKQKKYFEPT